MVIIGKVKVRVQKNKYRGEERRKIFGSQARYVEIIKRKEKGKGKTGNNNNNNNNASRLEWASGRLVRCEKPNQPPPPTLPPIFIVIIIPPYVRTYGPVGTRVR